MAAGKIAKRIDYLSTGDPFLVLEPSHPDALSRHRASDTPPFAVRMEDAWQYSPDHNPGWERFLANVCWELFGLYFPGEMVTTRDLAQIADTVMYGIIDLLEAKPLQDAHRTIGEVELYDGATKIHSGDIVESKPDPAEILGRC